jgi:Putative viral replication protein
VIQKSVHRGELIITSPLDRITPDLISLFFSHKNSMSLAKNWAFTLNNYTEDDIGRILSAFNTGRIEYIVYGKEVGASGTPHLQGTVVLKKKIRCTGLVKLVGQAHYSVCRNLQHSIDYCKKSGDVIEFGHRPTSECGKRNDLEAFKDAVKSGITDHKVLRETHSACMARYQRFCLSYIRDHKPLPSLPSHTLHAWQSHLVDIVSEPPCPRSIYFFVDIVGNKGKSFMCSYLERTFENVQVMKCGKRDDMAFELDDSVKILVIDVSRSSSDYLSYQFLEDVKDGRVFSPKYESYTKRFNTPHVVLMMNAEPDGTKLSADRYKIINI